MQAVQAEVVEVAEHEVQRRKEDLTGKDERIRVSSRTDHRQCCGRSYDHEGWTE